MDNGRKIILDCDPGHDDAIAIMLAGREQSLKLLGITVAAGNQTLLKTVKNALNVCQYLGLDVPVYAGCSVPMVREKQVIAADIHGESGLDGPVFEPLTLHEEPEHAVSYLIRTLMESDGDITLVATGPLTNLAMSMRLQPKIIPKIKEIIIMGGCYQLGNVTPAAEFNIFADAEAAHVVFCCKRKLTMVGLDVTRKVCCYPSVVERMNAVHNRASKLFTELMQFFNRSQKAVFGWEGGPLHDPVTIAALIRPELLVTKPMYAEVDLMSEQSYGRTNCDYFQLMPQKANVNVAVEIDVELFWNLIEQGIRNYN